MVDGLIVKTKVKEAVVECGKKYSSESVFNVGGDFADALDKKVFSLVEDAVKRAHENARKTAMAKDL